MSIRSRNSTGSSSIIKKSPSLKKRLSEIVQSTSKVKFQLPHNKKVRAILEEYVQEKQIREYQSLVCAVRDSDLTDDDIRNLLQEATECISILNRDLRLFVDALLLVNWIERNKQVEKEYQSFIVNLLSAHNYHSNHVIDKLVVLFLPNPQDPDWADGTPTEKDKRKCVKVHILLNTLLTVVPMSKEILLKALNRHYPYYNKSTHIQEYYLYNLLFILTYQPSFRLDILSLVFTKLVTMDVNAPKEEIRRLQEQEEDLFMMDDDTKSVQSSKTAFTKVDRPALGCALDICMDIIFNYIISECTEENGEVEWERCRKLYKDMIEIFDKIILPTYDTHHVQFVMFVMCGLKDTIAEGFLTYLWKKVCNPNVASVLRQTAITYVASMVARANFIPLLLTKWILQEMADWIHKYIENQDGVESINSDVRVHSVFYSVCQALFYIISFRHKDFVSSKKNIIFLESLNMTKMVTSRLNPLRVCQPAVVQNFATITRKYQLAYCYTIIDHNSRNTMPVIYQNEKGTAMVSKTNLNVFYPFDPYILERSGRHVYPLYIEYKDSFEDSGTEPEMKEAMEVDDFLEHSPEAIHNVSSKTMHKFSYGTSPGFKFN